MTKLLTQAIERVRELPASDQDAAAEALFVHVASGDPGYRLTSEQADEVRRIQHGLRTHKTRFATKQEMENLWRKCGI